MQQKIVASKLYFCAEKTLTIPEIANFAEQTLCQMNKELERLAIDITGPPEFHYFNVEPGSDKPFHLLICIPVKEQMETEQFFFIRTEPFPCAFIDFRGSMENLGTGWMELVENAMRKGYLLTNQGREVYKQWESFSSENNLTELQMGICGQKL